MAQAGFTPIQLYYSATTTNVPLAGSLAFGELAINITDGKLFYKDNISAIRFVGQPRVVVIADATSITINADTTDMATQANTQSVGTLTINAPTGTPYNGQKLLLRLRSTNVQTFAWNAIFQGSTDLILPTSSSGASKFDYVGFIYNSTAAKWQVVAKNFGF
jgi:hypothetical protein